MGLESPEPILLNDEQMREYIANGYVVLRSSVPDEVHRIIDEKFNFICEHEFNPGNNIIPRLPELELVLKSPEVHGALISVLGENYVTHPHRFWHLRNPEGSPLSKEKVVERVSGGCHQDQYSPTSQPRSHLTRYARIMYYSQDTPIELGPTHVIPGSQYHDALTDEDRGRTLPVRGTAGHVFLSHFDIGHAAGVNLQERSRHMIKFIYMRAEEPTGPTWNNEHSEWQPPRNLTAPYDLEPAWRNLWNWHRAKKRASSAVRSEPKNRSVPLESLASEGSVEEKLSALAELARAGPEAADAVPSIVEQLNTGHQSIRTSAIYTLASIGEPAIDALVQTIEKAGERESASEDPLDFDNRWFPLDDASYALGAIGSPAVEPLIRLLKSPHEWTLINAAFALEEMDSEAASAVPALAELLNDESHYVIRMATNALGTIQTNAPVESISRLLNADRPGWDEPKNWGWTVRNAVNITAAIALTRLGQQSSESEAALIEALQNPFDQVGFFVVQALNRIGTETAKQAVIDDLISHRWDTSLSKQRLF